MALIRYASWEALFYQSMTMLPLAFRYTAHETRHYIDCAFMIPRLLMYFTQSALAHHTT